MLGTNSELVLGPFTTLELESVLGLGCDSGPIPGFGLILGLTFEVWFELLLALVASSLEFDWYAKPCLELELCLDKFCSSTLVFELDVAWEIVEGRFESN